MRQFFLALGCSIFVMFSALPARAQTQAPTAINPLTGPSFPCPKPQDPLAQLFCTSPQLALLDMQFVKTYDALHQQIGPAGDQALRKEDIQLELTIRSQCGIALPQGNSPTLPPPAPPGSDQCVIAAYQQQIAIWKSRLYGAAAEEANRSIPGQIALQARLQELGFLPAQAQLDSVFGSGTRAAIVQWQNSVGRPPTGLLGDADAEALMAIPVPNASSGQAPPNTAPAPPNNATGNNEISDEQQACSAIRTLPNVLLETIIEKYDPSLSPFANVDNIQIIQTLAENNDFSFSTTFDPPSKCNVKISVSGIVDGNSYQSSVNAQVEPVEFKNNKFCQSNDSSASACITQTTVFLNLPD